MKIKKEKHLWIFSITVFIIILSCFIITKNLTTTTYGKLDTLFGVITKMNDYFNPSSLEERSVYEIRKVLHNQATKWTHKSITSINIKNIDIKTTFNQVPVRIYSPDNGSKLPLIIYSHGGSWISGNIDDYDNICRKLSKYTNAIVISVNYRLAPEDPFPAGLNDVYNVLQWTSNNAESISGDPTRICVAGDSAGGNLSAAVSQMSRNEGGPKITSQVLIYPSTNIYELNTKSWEDFGMNLNLKKKDFEKFISLYVPKLEDRKSSYASPLLSQNLKGLPNTLIITAELDPLRDEGETYGQKLKESGVEVIYSRYTGVTHGFVSMDGITRKADKALKEISEYLQKQFSKT